MPSAEADTTKPPPKPLGMRKNGKQWHAPRKAFRPGSGLTSYEKRAKDRVTMAAVKAKEKEMKDEKEAERQVRGSRGWRRRTSRNAVIDVGAAANHARWTIATYPGDQGQEGCKGGEGEI
ncbi:hypothetical protein RB595_009676 [Gaeumannomyces hyphopodioides]